MCFFQYLHLLSNSEELYVILSPTILPLTLLFFIRIFIQHLLVYHALILGLKSHGVIRCHNEHRVSDITVSDWGP